MGVHPRKAPPMFRYCGDDSSLDLVSLIGLSGDDHKSWLNGAQTRCSTTISQALKQKVFIGAFVATNWIDIGILQLLRLYPRKLPDLGLFFGCGNRTVIGKRDYMGVHPRKAPPMFRYCGDDSSLDLVSLIGLSGDDHKSWLNGAQTRCSTTISQALKQKVFIGAFVATNWIDIGILQLLRLYPRKLPDLGLFFGCGNRTVIGKRDYMGVHPRKAPPMFRYCGDDSSLDLVSLIGLSGDDTRSMLKELHGL
ncbi:unnamed protein product [Ilex paraguariensis]|uniref:Glycosyl transferase CAP10 domain-containing protein n=1 Tax=Ilex paraguariensis TaxID=185542 RepID=A0ABC8UGG5_9AQUA